MRMYVPAVLALAAAALPAIALSAHSVTGKGPSEPEAKQEAKNLARQNYGNSITSWGREDCAKKVEQPENRATQDGPYAVHPTPPTVYYLCEVEFTTRD